MLASAAVPSWNEWKCQKRLADHPSVDGGHARYTHRQPDFEHPEIPLVLSGLR